MLELSWDSLSFKGYRPRDLLSLFLGPAVDRRDFPSTSLFLVFQRDPLKDNISRIFCISSSIFGLYSLCYCRPCDNDAMVSVSSFYRTPGKEKD